jgi:sugar lactone lactonase YvrE
MPGRIEARVLYHPHDAALRYLPEGPYPLGPSQLSWVAIQHAGDSPQGSLNIFDLRNGNNRSHVLPGRPGFAFPCDDGQRFIIGCERELGLFDPIEALWSPFCADVDEDVRGTIINDGLVYEDNLIFGTKDLEFSTPKAGLYLWRGSDRRLIRLRSDQICSNGKAILPGIEGRPELLDIDSPTRRIVAYPLDVARGSLGAARTVVDLSDDPAVPDGAVLTPDGRGVIVSMYNPNPVPEGETRLYDLESGTLQGTWTTPGSPQNTCPNFVEHEGRIHLVITTAVENMPEKQRESAREAGSLFIAPTDYDSIGSAPRFPLKAIEAV